MQFCFKGRIGFTMMKEAKIEIYIEKYDQFKSLIESDLAGKDYVNLCIIDYNLLDSLSDEDLRLFKDGNFCLALPYVSRRNSPVAFDRALKLVNDGIFQSIMVRNPEELGYFSLLNEPVSLISDAGLYAFNKRAVETLFKSVSEVTLPVELNKGERLGLIESIDNSHKDGLCVIAYGRIPMMLSANCIYKTTDICDGKGNNDNYGVLTDRLGNKFPVIRHCDECMNIIYNCLPLSIHKDLYRYKDCMLRLNFTVESGKDMLLILGKFTDLLLGNADDISADLEKILGGYTTGHEKRGVE